MIIVVINMTPETQWGQDYRTLQSTLVNLQSNVMIHYYEGDEHLFVCLRKCTRR
jgi:hypothetical protein